MKTILLITFLFFQFTTVNAQLPVRGKGEYKWMWMSIYEATLKAPPGSDLYLAPLELQLTYKREFDGRDIAVQTNKELIRAGVDQKIINEWSDELHALFPNVKEGDTIRALYDPKKGITFYLGDNKILGTISDLQYAKHFLNIWLGPKTSAPELRKILLGEK